jgi:hypothetical protein
LSYGAALRGLKFQPTKKQQNNIWTPEFKNSYNSMATDSDTRRTKPNYFKVYIALFPLPDVMRGVWLLKCKEE